MQVDVLAEHLIFLKYPPLGLARGPRTEAYLTCQPDVGELSFPPSELHRTQRCGKPHVIARLQNIR